MIVLLQNRNALIQYTLRFNPLMHSGYNMYYQLHKLSILATECIPLRTPLGLLIHLLHPSITRNYNYLQLFLPPVHMYTAYNHLHGRN
jgi:hypothetical protein